jgi:hypothetical protein
MTNQVFPFEPSVHSRNYWSTDFGYRTSLFYAEIFFTPLACRRGNPLNFRTIFFGLFILLTWFFGVLFSFFFLFFFFFRISLISPSRFLIPPLISTILLSSQETKQDHSTYL